MAVPAVRYRHVPGILTFGYLAFLILANEVENQRPFLGKIARLLTAGSVPPETKILATTLRTRVSPFF